MNMRRNNKSLINYEYQLLLKDKIFSRTSDYAEIESGEIMIRVLPDSYEIDLALQLTVEDDFSLFIMFDDQADPIVKPDKELPSIADSCYIPRDEAFSVSWF